MPSTLSPASVPARWLTAAFRIEASPRKEAAEMQLGVGVGPAAGPAPVSATSCIATSSARSLAPIGSGTYDKIGWRLGEDDEEQGRVIMTRI